MSSVRAQDANMMKYGLNGGLGYAFGANQGIGIGVGVELDYNLTKTVPFGIFARLDLYHGQLVGTGGFSFSYVHELAADRYLEFRGRLGGSILPDKTNPMLGMNIGLGIYYQKLLTKNTYFYIGPAFNGIFNGSTVQDNMQIIVLDGGIGFYLR
jgi:hypothetical protein